VPEGGLAINSNGGHAVGLEDRITKDLVFGVPGEWCLDKTGKLCRPEREHAHYTIRYSFDANPSIQVIIAGIVQRHRHMELAFRC
jgi:hypothetical protein